LSGAAEEDKDRSPTEGAARHKQGGDRFRSRRPVKEENVEARRKARNVHQLGNYPLVVDWEDTQGKRSWVAIQVQARSKKKMDCKEKKYVMEEGKSEEIKRQVYTHKGIVLCREGGGPNALPSRTKEAWEKLASGRPR